MTIEFHCPHCEKLLKTADDKAGVRAKCPGCGEVVTVPAPQIEAAGVDSSFDDAFAMPAGGDAPPPIPQAPSAGIPAREDEMRPCPMCGESIRAASTRCRYCGEDLVGGPQAQGVPTQIEAGEILSRSWAIFQKEMGMSIAIVLIGGTLNFLAQMVPNIPGWLLQAGAVNQDAFAMVLVAQVVLTVITLCVQGYISLGISIAMLKIARGEPVEIGDLFGGGPYFLRGAGAGIVYGMMSMVGMLCCLVGALVVYLMFDFYKFSLVDRNVGAMESLSNSYRITQNNLMALFLISLAALGLIILGAIPCGLGLLIVGPYLALVWAVAYLSMSGLPTAEQRRPA